MDINRGGGMDAKNKQKVVVFDLEGTLTDHYHRIHHYESKNYSDWNALFIHDPVNPEGENLFRAYQKNRGKIFIVTAKNENYCETVEGWLKGYGFWNHISGIYYRDKLDTRPSVPSQKRNFQKDNGQI